MEDYIEQDPTLYLTKPVLSSPPYQPVSPPAEYYEMKKKEEYVNEYTYEDLAKVFLDIENEIKIIFKNKYDIDIPYVFEDFIVDLFYRSYVTESDEDFNDYDFYVDEDEEKKNKIFSVANGMTRYLVLIPRTFFDIIYQSIITNLNLYNIIDIEEATFKIVLFKIFLIQLLGFKRGQYVVNFPKTYDEFILELKYFMRKFDEKSYITDETFLKKSYTDLGKIIKYYNMDFELEEIRGYYKNNFNFYIPNMRTAIIKIFFDFIYLFANILLQSTYMHPEIKNRDSFLALVNYLQDYAIDSQNLNYFKFEDRQNEFFLIKKLMEAKLTDFYKSKIESYLYYDKPQV